MAIKQNKTKEHICIIARNKRFFEYVANTLKKAEYEYVDVTNTENCCDKEKGYNCALKIVATVDSQNFGHSINIPIIMLGGSDDINSILESIKIGAFDFVERIMANKEKNVPVKNAQRRKNHQFDEYKRLTKTERIVLHQIMKGKSNRQIANKFHRSIRTIEDHRNHIMQKLHADNLVELVKKCIK